MVTVITKTIGAGGGYDYANFQTAESAVESIATTAFGSTDLVASDGAIVFEAVAGTYNEAVTFSSTLTTDATRNVTYKAAAGSEHGGIADAGVLVDASGINRALDIRDENISLIQLSAKSNFQAAFVFAAGTVFQDCTFNATSNSAISLANDAGLVAKNCVVRYTSNGFYPYISTGYAASLECVNCTAIQNSGATGFDWQIVGAGGSVTASLVNCLSLGANSYLEAASGGGTTSVTGSNNFGESTNPFPPALQGTPATITASTAYDPGAGDFALYVGKNGALLDSPNNDVIDQGVGPSVNSDVPTTDILGNARSGATANPGAFEVPQATTIITKTIGPSGDYASFTTAEADVTNIGTSTDLVYENEAIVFEAAAGTYNESVTFSSTLTTDATRNVTYKPAAGSEHGGVRGAGVHVTSASSFAFRVQDQNLALVGLSVHSSHSSSTAFLGSRSPFSCESCIFAVDHGVVGVGAAQLNPGQPGLMLFTNCVFERAGAANDVIYVPTFAAVPISIELQSCTLRNGSIFLNNTTASGVINIELVNTLALGGNAYTALGSGTINASGSNNFGPATNPFPPSIQGTPATITPTTSFSTPLGSGDYAVYMGATGALANVTGNDVWQQGVGPASNPDVPTTDINGVTRSGTSCNPGAFEADGFVAPTVITRTIGAAGPPTYDYASFTLAENAVTSIGTGTDLTFYNEAIVFEAVAGTYNETVTFLSTLTTDATRNVTYKPAAGSEHGGVPGAGVHITSSGITTAIRDDYTRLIGLSAYSSGSTVFWQPAGVGSLREDCIGHVGGTSQTCFYSQGGTASAPHVFRNCVAYTDGSQQAWSIGAYPGVDGYAEVYNCTAMSQWMTVYANAATMNAKLVNCMAYGIAFRTQEISGGTAVVTGSNNFGGATNSFPVGIQGVPYPITATTDVDPGPGDWAIYDAATGALIDDPDNDVLAGGIGPDANPDVPTTDILGNTRSGATTDPGAFEISTLAPPEPALITIMRQIYQQDASFSVGASSAGVEKITHQLGPGSADFFTINSSTSATVSVPRTAHALRIICVVAAKACDVTLDLDASNSVFLGSIGGVASVQTDLTYFWSFGQVVSDGTYPRVRIVNDGFAGDQNVYLWWHLA